MKRKVLVVAAHPDDEVLGMGGTIARHIDDGDSVNILFLGHGVGSRGSSLPQEISKRKSSAKKACTVLGAQILGVETFPDNAFDSVTFLEIVKAVEKAKAQVGPDIVYTHHGGDLNIDHRISCQAVLTAFRPQPREIYSEIRCFEVNSSTAWGGMAGLQPFLPDTYVDISMYLEKLLEAYGCYDEEIRPEPHARSLESLRISALHRGREVGFAAAEAFVTLRRIIR